jgi:hypothetical protein
MQATAVVERGTAAVTLAEARDVRVWVEEVGEVAVAEETGLSRLTLARVAAALPVHAASRIAARAGLARRRQGGGL